MVRYCPSVRILKVSSKTLPKEKNQLLLNDVNFYFTHDVLNTKDQFIKILFLHVTQYFPISNSLKELLNVSSKIMKRICFKNLSFIVETVEFKDAIELHKTLNLKRLLLYGGSCIDLNCKYYAVKSTIEGFYT